MNNVVAVALSIARDAHKDQKRKWGNEEPYIVHPEWCANKAKEIGCDEVEQCAMFLHDVIEDIAIPTNSVPYWEARIKVELGDIGEKVLFRVWELTNISDTREWMDANPNPRRSEKWAVNLAHIKVISNEAKRNKMIDRLANVLTMDGAPYRMKVKYIPESRELLNECRHADPVLADELEAAIQGMERQVG